MAQGVGDVRILDKIHCRLQGTLVLCFGFHAFKDGLVTELALSDQKCQPRETSVAAVCLDDFMTDRVLQGIGNH